jgi:putative aminopeptidase FrvX
MELAATELDPSGPETKALAALKNAPAEDGDKPNANADLDLLFALVGIPGVSGDEGAVAAFLEGQLSTKANVALHRIGDSLIAVKGTPKTAIFAHTDTVGYTLGYERELIPVGSPRPPDGAKLRCAEGLTGRVRFVNGKPVLRRVRNPDGNKAKPRPGTRWVYACKSRVQNDVVFSPYLDDRAGVWSALHALERCENIAVAFCTGEEQHGHGARVCADYLFRTHQITQALIADITWHTDQTPCGKGVVISLRDAFCPRQAFLDRVLTVAQQSNIAIQCEIQSAGSSDGGHILRSSVPIDWVFIGAPEKDPHTPRESAHVSDLHAMTDLLTYLVQHLP